MRRKGAIRERKWEGKVQCNESKKMGRIGAIRG